MHKVNHVSKIITKKKTYLSDFVKIVNLKIFGTLTKT